MNLQWAGIILAVATFATIAVGHELVRKLHRRFGVKPGIFFWVLSLGVFIGSFSTGNDLLSAVLGIIGITFFWDGIEMYRQEKRIKREAATPK